MMLTLVFTGLSKSYNSLLMSVEAIRCFPRHCWSRRFWYIGTVGWNLESLFFFMLRSISASQLPIGLHGTNTSKDDRSDVSTQLGVVVPQLRLQRTPPYRTTRHQVDQKVLRCVRATHSIPFQIPLTAPGPGPAERMPRPFMALRFEV